MRTEIITVMLEASLREQWGAPELQVIGLDGQRGSDDLREQPWLPVKYGSVDPGEWHGLVHARARFRRRPGAPAETLPLVAKVAPRRGLAQTLIPWIIERESVRLPRRYGEFDAARESTGTAPREYETYRLARSVAALGRTLPGWYGGGPSADGEYVVFLEEIHHPLLTDPGGEIAGWAGEQIDAALEAVGGIHAAFLGRGELASAYPWAGPRADTASFARDAGLWRGLLDDARRRHPAIITDAVWRRRHRLIDDIGNWHPAKDRMPATLVHDDYNQRNVGFRPGPDGRPGGVVVFDWELTSIDAPPRDVAELLCFALSPDADRLRVDAHLETYWRALTSAAPVRLDEEIFRAAFVAELHVEALNRVGMQLLFGAAFPLPYLARLNATVERLLDLYAGDTESGL